MLILNLAGNRVDRQFNSTHTQVYNGELSVCMKLPWNHLIVDQNQHQHVVVGGVGVGGWEGGV